MTEAEWLTGSRVEEMLKHLGPSGSPRKLRYFLVACARRVFPPDPDPEMVEAVAVAERFADQAASIRDLARARTALKAQQASRAIRWGPLYSDHIRSLPAWHATREQAVRAAAEGARCCAWSSTRTTWGNHTVMTFPEEELRAQADLLRDIFGNPFRHPVFVPPWRSPDVVQLARGIYEDRAFDRMPILADALEDAGCADPDILSHCRSGGEHGRGCWVVDLVLGRE
jgi:hypothetical protein